MGGNFQVSDLGIHITGTTPTTGWTIFGLPTLYWMAHGFVVLGTRANAVFSRVDVEGEYAPSATADFNLGNGIFFEGFIGEVSPPISGSLVLLDSTFRNLESSAPIFNVSDASIQISRNNFQDGFDAMDVGGLLNSRYEFSFNTVEGGFVRRRCIRCAECGNGGAGNGFADSCHQQRLQRAAVWGLP